MKPKLRIAGLAILLGLLGHSVEAQTPTLSASQWQEMCASATRLELPDMIAKYCNTAPPQKETVSVSAAASGSSAYQWEEEDRVAHPRIRTTGAVMMLFGFGMMLPYGDHYRIFGEDVCVTRYEVDYGTCGPSHMALFVGGVTAMTGIMLIKIGNRKVHVSPTVSRQATGVTASVAW